MQANILDAAQLCQEENSAPKIADCLEKGKDAETKNERVCESEVERCASAPWFSIVDYDGPVVVVDVYDGDTITVAVEFQKKTFRCKCRLFGIDTPEKRSRDAAERAAAAVAFQHLSARLLHRRVRMKCVGVEKYGRFLCLFYTENGQESGSFATDEKATVNGLRGTVNGEMVERGLACVYDGGTKIPFSAWWARKSD